MRRRRPGNISLNSSTRLPLPCTNWWLTPVMTPPGRASDCTNPSPTGSLTPVMMMGIPFVSSFAICTAKLAIPTMTSTGLLAKFRAKLRNSGSVPIRRSML